MCIRDRSFDPEKHFNRYTVRYLYLLNIIALKVRSVSKFSCWIEVGQCNRMTGKHLSLNAPPFMPVSYTHLDVYKRQRLVGTYQRVFFNEQVHRVTQ